MSGWSFLWLPLAFFGVAFVYKFIFEIVFAFLQSLLSKTLLDSHDKKVLLKLAGLGVLMIALAYVFWAITSFFFSIAPSVFGLPSWLYVMALFAGFWVGKKLLRL